MSIGGHHSARAQTVKWLTPPEWIERLGPFDLDPCSLTNRPWDTAKKHYTQSDDGLRQDWGSGFVWCNPPYGRDIKDWLRKMALHENGIALVFARTETEAFFDWVWKGAAGLFFIKGRLHFHYPSGERAKANAGAPSVLIAYGHDAADRLAKLDPSLGVFVDSWVP